MPENEPNQDKLEVVKTILGRHFFGNQISTIHAVLDKFELWSAFHTPCKFILSFHNSQKDKEADAIQIEDITYSCYLHTKAMIEGVAEGDTRTALRELLFGMAYRILVELRSTVRKSYPDYLTWIKHGIRKACMSQEKCYAVFEDLGLPHLEKLDTEELALSKRSIPNRNKKPSTRRVVLRTSIIVFEKLGELLQNDFEAIPSSEEWEEFFQAILTQSPLKTLRVNRKKANLILLLFNELFDIEEPYLAFEGGKGRKSCGPFLETHLVDEKGKKLFGKARSNKLRLNEKYKAKDAKTMKIYADTKRIIIDLNKFREQPKDDNKTK